MAFDNPILQPFISYVDVISEVVASIPDARKPKLFTYGDGEYIADLLTALSQSRSKRSSIYPMIAVLNDFPEVEDVITVQMVFANSTRKEYTNDQRKDNNFVPVLQPMLDAFFDACRRHPRIDGRYDFQHEKYDLYSLGRKAIFDNRILLNEYVDAIQVRNLKLQILKK